MKLTKTCARFLRKNGGTLLTIGASVGVVLTAIETGKATIKAEKLVELNKDVPEYGMKEKVKDCWHFYIPAAVLGAGTIGCIIGSNMLSRKEIASLSAAYVALGKSYQEYRRQVAERIGVEEEEMIKDSGDRTEFETGAKRDMHAGKGRMDLLPWYGIMEVSKHCEEGALKYGEHNVDKGIPLHSLLDSASRHLAKYMVGMDDEDHLRAACWNLLWALNQRVTHPELDDRFTVKEKKAAKMVLTKCANCGKEWPVSEDDWVRMCAWSFSLKRDSAITRCPDCREVARIYKVGEVSTDE